MAEPIAIRITNLPQIRAAFSRAPYIMTGELNIAIEKTVFSIQRKSMINTPVDTGRLRASTRSLFSNLKGEVGTNTNYDIFVHNGTRYMPGRPYLSQAVESSELQTDIFFKRAVQNTLDKIGGMT